MSTWEIFKLAKEVRGLCFLRPTGKGTVELLASTGDEIFLLSIRERRKIVAFNIPLLHATGLFIS